MILIQYSKLSYKAKSAASNQISQMNDAFRTLLKDDFLFIENKFIINLGFFSKYLKNIKVIKDTFLILISTNQKVVFSRDFLPIYILSFFKKKVCYELHQPKKGFIANYFFNKFLKNKDVNLIVISNSLKSYIYENYNKIECKIKVLHSASPLIYKFKNSSILNRIKLNDKKLILHTGSLYKDTSKQLIILSKYIDDRFFFIHIGGGQNECNNLKSQIDKKNFLILPNVKHQESIYLQSKADLLLYLNSKNSPIYKYTSPLKIFEYLVSGKPIIANNIGSVGEILDDKNAIIFDIEIDDSFKNSLEACIKNYSKHLKIAKSNKAIYSKKNYIWRASEIIKFIDPEEKFSWL